MQIGPYEIVLELGRGGMGTVYLARLRGAGGFERLVAVKRANVTSVAADEARKRFLQEARLAASVHHANVVGIHQVGEDEVGPYLVCDYVEGESMARLIEVCRPRGHVPTRITLRVIHDALAGLAAVHDAVDGNGKPMGILHRDVSIDNLLVGCDGVTRLADFGVAKSMAEPRLTDTGRIHGKVLYLAPEHLMGEERDRSADTYAMGVTLWIALADGLPFNGRDYDTLVHQVLAQPVPPLSAVGAQVGPELEAFVARACHRERAQRFASAQAMMEALEAVASRECPMAGHREVASFMNEMVGESLALRRERIAASTPTLVDAFIQAAPNKAERVSAWASDARATQPLPVRRSHAGTARALIIAATVLIVAMVATYAVRRSKHASSATHTAQPEPISKPTPAATAPRAEPLPPPVEVSPVTPSLAAQPIDDAALEESRPRAPQPREIRRPRAPTPAVDARPAPAAGTSEPPAAPGIATQNPYR